jgi:hypothetical protein
MLKLQTEVNKPVRKTKIKPERHKKETRKKPERNQK